MKETFYINSYNGRKSKFALVLSSLGFMLGLTGLIVTEMNFFTTANNIFLLTMGILGVYTYFNPTYISFDDNGYEFRTNIFKRALTLSNEEVKEIHYGLSNLRITTKSGKDININLTVLGYEDRQKIKRHIRDVDMDRFEIYHN